LTIELDLERIVSPTLSRLASLIEGDAARLALSSGEEYSLLVAAPGALDSELASLGLERIGALRHGPSVVVCSDGTVIDPLSAHDHLSSAKSGDAPSSS
jgi:thiamine monophosphate kinase